MNEFFEEERHRCEVRYVIKLRNIDRQRMIDYLELVKKERKETAAKKLEQDARDQWNKGNRGIHGDWR